MKYTAEMGSGAMICMRIFIKIGSGIQKLIRDSETQRRRGALISVFFFFQNKARRKKWYLVSENLFSMYFLVRFLIGI
jgi:hypothetical protein